MWDDEYDDLPGLDKNKRDIPTIRAVETVQSSSIPNDVEGVDLLDNDQSEDLFSPLASLGGDRVKMLEEKVANAEKQQEQARTDYQGMIDKINQESLDDVQPGMSEQELDRRRQAGTMVTSIASALANIANGIAVSRGALNATVPDGYSLSYQHWNDIEERNRKRRAEYQKIVDSINARKLELYKASYKEAQTNTANATTQLEKELGRQNAINIAAINAETRKEMNDADNEQKKWETEYKAAHPKTSKSGSGSSASSSSKIESYRTVNRDGSDISIPSGVSVIDGWMAMRNAALKYIDDNKDKIPNWSTKWDNIAAIKSFSGSDADKIATIKKLQAAIDALDIENDDLMKALQGLQPAPQTTTTSTSTRRSNNNSSSNGNGRTGSNDSGLF